MSTATKERRFMYQAMIRMAVEKMKHEQRMDVIHRRLMWRMARRAKQLSCNETIN